MSSVSATCRFSWSSPPAGCAGSVDANFTPSVTWSLSGVLPTGEVSSTSVIPEVEGGRKDKKESGRGDEKDGCPYRNFEAIVLVGGKGGRGGREGREGREGKRVSKKPLQKTLSLLLVDWHNARYSSLSWGSLPPPHSITILRFTTSSTLCHCRLSEYWSVLSRHYRDNPRLCNCFNTVQLSM